MSNAYERAIRYKKVMARWPPGSLTNGTDHELPQDNGGKNLLFEGQVVQSYDGGAAGKGFEAG